MKRRLAEESDRVVVIWRNMGWADAWLWTDDGTAGKVMQS